MQAQISDAALGLYPNASLGVCEDTNSSGNSPRPSF